MEKLDKSPPKINPKRKNMKVVNNKAMVLFGSEAFGVHLGDKADEDTEAQQITRLTSQRSSLLKSPLVVKEATRKDTSNSPHKKMQKSST